MIAERAILVSSNEVPLSDCPIHTTNSKTLCSLEATQSKVQQPLNLHKSAKGAHRILCVSILFLYFRQFAR